MIPAHVFQITMIMLVLKPVSNVIIDVKLVPQIITFVIHVHMILEKMMRIVFVKIITLIFKIKRNANLVYHLVKTAQVKQFV